MREQKITEQVTTSMDREDAAGAAEDDDAEERTTGTSMSQTGDENAEREQRYEIPRTVTNKQLPGPYPAVDRFCIHREASAIGKSGGRSARGH